MKIIDTYQDLLNLKEKVCQNPNKIYRFWEEYIDKCATELKQKIIKDSKKYDFEAEIKPILLSSISTDFYKLEIAHNNFMEIVSHVQATFNKTFQCQEEIAVYFYCGLCNGAGWATIVENKNAILLGAEKIVELNWQEKEQMQALLYHELCHAAHSMLRGRYIGAETIEKCNKPVWQLYIEGFAQRHEQLLIGKEEFYHQDKCGWLKWCKDNKVAIAREYYCRILNKESTQDFFGDWVSYLGHSDVGYYLGCEFIKSIETKYTIEEIAKLSVVNVSELVKGFLGNTI